MVKRVLLGLLLGLLIAANVFGGGSKELKNGAIYTFKALDATGKNTVQQYSVKVNFQLGKTTAELILTNEQKNKIGYAVLKYGDFYCNPVIEPGDNLKEEINTFFTGTNYPATVYTLKNADKVEQASGEYWSGTASKSFNSAQQALFKIEKSSIIKIPWSINSEAIDYSLLLVNNDKWNYERLNFTIQPEFFDGEFDLFSSVSGYTYKQKALAFMNTFFENETDFRTFIKQSIDNTIATNAALWNMFSGKDITKQKANFKYSLANHMGMGIYKQLYGNTYNLPYLKIDRYDFDTLYGAGRNVYISTYLYFLFTKNKPVFSYLFQTELKSKGINYNYNKYQALSLAEGQNLAVNALQYLTWGVEYTPFMEKDKTIKQGFAGNPVFGRYFNSINEWANNGDSPFTPVNINILETTGSGAPKKMQAIDGDFYTDNIRLITQVLNDTTPMQASRIDLWTSTNLAWKSNLINTRIAEVINPDGSKITAQPDWGNTANLNDRRLAHGTGNNLSIARPNPDSLIRVGYEFNTQQKVKAICIVRGDAATPDPANKSEYIQIAYKEAGQAGTEEKNLAYSKNNKNFTEYAAVPWDMIAKGITEQFYIYNGAANGGVKPGYGIYSNQFATGNNLVYSYIILDKAIENCTEIILIDKTKNSFLNITEFMVFPENPLDYIITKKSYLQMTAKNNQQYKILQNCNLATGTVLNNTNDKVKYFDIQLLKAFPVKSVVLWESNSQGDHGTNSDIYKAPLYVLGGNYGLIGEEYFAHSAGKLNTIITATNELGITTPYTITGTGTGDRGNPLPYAPGGIDNPQTFAYKMYEQWRAREWLNKPANYVIPQDKTTQAKEGDYAKYIGEPDVFTNKLTVNNGTNLYTNASNYNPPGPSWTFQGLTGDRIKPFMPGYISSNKDGYVMHYNSPWQPDKIAGVDSLGLLMGSLNMAKLYLIYDALNNPIISNLASYYDMAQNKPVYYVDNQSQQMNKNYRFTIADIERNTVLVPDISLIQPGDILVNYNLKDEEVHIGLIVGNIPWTTQPQYGENIRNYWDNVLVLSVRRGFQMVNIGRWGNSEGVTGGFTENPDDYHIRRLLKKYTDEGGDTACDDWELVNNVIKKLTCKVTLPPDAYNGGAPNHWIPNTDEGLSGITIKTNMELTSGIINPIPDDLNNIKVLPPRDPYFNLQEAKDEEKMNINTNKGTGMEFWAGNTEGKRYKIATFTRKPYDDKQIEDTHYTVEYNPAYFLGDGKAKPGYRLFVADSGNLCFRDDSLVQNITDPKERIDIDTFEVKATGTIRPGDDFLLRFGHVSDMGEPAVAAEGDFVAVYDKKMLWRANLYIDERKEENGNWKVDAAGIAIGNRTANCDWNDFSVAEKNLLDSLDWNGRNPWTAAQGNEWDTRGDGKQCIIEPWTHAANVPIYNRVSYNLAAHDNLFQFNTKIKAQNKALAKKNNNPNYPCPPATWMDYVSASDWITDKKTIEQVKDLYKNYAADEKPYLPGLITKRPDGALRRYSAGTECSGFVHRACAWSSATEGSNTYYYKYMEYADDLTQYWDDASDISVQGVKGIALQSYSWLINDISKEAKDSKYLSSLPLVPGDMIILFSDKDSSNHIAIIQSIKYANGRRFLTSGVTLIESAWGEKNEERHSVVMNWQTLDTYFSGDITGLWNYSWHRLRVYGNNN